MDRYHVVRRMQARALALLSSLALIAAVLVPVSAQANAFLIDSFSGATLGTRTISAGPPPQTATNPPASLTEVNGIGVINLTDGNVASDISLTYTPSSAIDLSAGGTNTQFLLDFASISRNPSDPRQSTLTVQIFINTNSGTLQYNAGISETPTQANMALPWSSFTGTGDLTQVTSVQIFFYATGNHYSAVVNVDRIYASPPFGAVPTPPAGGFSAVTGSPTASSTINYTLSFGDSFGAAAVQGLTASDIILSGTAGATTAVITGGPSSYNVAVTGMTTDGTVIASIGPGAVTDIFIQDNTAGATSSAVTYELPPVFTNGPPPASATLGSSYSFGYTASGIGPITYSISSGALPTNLSVSSAGLISGTPTALGFFTGTARAANLSPTDQAFAITVSCPAINVGPTTVAAAAQFAAYSAQTLGAVGANGLSGTFAFLVSSGSLPNGMSLSTGGVLTGPATQAGNFNFTVQATGPNAYPCMGTRSYSLVVAPAVIVVSPATLANPTRSVAFSQNISASGSPGPFTFAVTSGALPGGLSLAPTGNLSGTPTTPGSFSFTVTASDGVTPGGPYSGSQAYTMVVAKSTQTITFTGPANQNFSLATIPLVATSDSTLPVTISSLTGTVCSVTSTTLTMLTAGQCNLVATQTGDTNYLAAAAVPQSFTIAGVVPDAPVIGAATPGVGQISLTFTPPASNGGLPLLPYNVTCTPGPVSASGASSPIVVTNLISGTTYTCSVKAVNSMGEGPASGTVSALPGIPPAFTSANNTAFTVYTAGTFTVAATGTPAPTLTLTGSLPGGVTFNATTGVLSGSPVGTSVGSYPLTLTATNGLTPDATQNFTLTVSQATPGALALVSGGGQSTRVGTPFAAPIVVKLTDSGSNPIIGATVSWTAPSIGASAAFGTGGTATTDVNGNATISATANGISGAYAVSAQSGSATTSANLTNTITATLGNSCAQPNLTVQDLIEQDYQALLRRPSDPAGASFWASEAARICALGVDARRTFVVLGNVFLNSPEYASFGRSDADYVTDLYVAFLGRMPDVGGLAYWTGQLGAGLPRNIVLDTFVFSPEFSASMQGLFGNVSSRAEAYAVVDLYGGYFRRLPDDNGFSYWDGRFRTAQCYYQPPVQVLVTMDQVTGQMLRSPEYAGRNRSDSEYVQDLYYAMLQRGGDLAGFNFWVSQLGSNAQTRDQVRVQFLNSPEMQARIAAIAAVGCQ
jgi:Domain of unknown function (DUF4214)/Putative Ig domain/Fibronectin type III domain